MTPKQKSPKKPEKQSTAPTADARRTALHILRCLWNDQPILEHIYADSEHYQLLDTRDKGLVRQLVMTTLRRLGQADAIIKTRLDRPLPSKYDEVRWILRLGIIQLMWMRVPDYAAVNSSVELVKRCDFPMHVGLVNAVLSGVAREADNIRMKLDDRFILPLWLWRKWSAHYGEDKARTMAYSLTHEPMLDITLHPDHQTQAEKYAEKLEGTLMPQGSVRRVSIGADVPNLEGFAEGHWWVQDAAASLPARLFGDITGKTIIDACAAPGGKTAQLATAGARITALDISPARLARLYENIRRLHLDNVHVVCDDALHWQPETLVDGVLLDAPCSATGTLRRHPEGLWQKRESDVTRLAELQHDLIQKTLFWLKPEGTLIYVTCSLEPEEGEMQIDRLLNERSDVSLAPITQREAASLGIPKSWVNKRGFLRILPHFWSEHGGVDGFFMARITKH